MKWKLAVCLFVALLVCMFEFIGQPFAIVHHLQFWDRKSTETLQQTSQQSSRQNSSGENPGLSDDYKEMSIKTGVDDSVGNFSEDTSIKSRAKCVGSDASLGEVEDLLCMPKPDYDDRMKNPCWWRNVTQTSALGLDVPSRSTASLSCLPYFHILCCSKSGTTDMYRRISMHPDIVPNSGIFGKERLFWSWGKYGNRHRSGGRHKPVPFEEYIRGFDVLTRRLEKAALHDPTELQRLITLDGSPPDLWDLRGWSKLPQNRNLRQPVVMTPHLMRHMYRDPKFIILVREPVERLYSAYFFHGQGQSASEFHQDVLKGISEFDRCLATIPNHIECFVNASVINNLPLDLPYSCYSPYFEIWLKAFPRKQFLFLRTEDYAKDMEGSLLKIFNFLNMSIPTTTELKSMTQKPSSYHTQKKDLAGPMWNKTRALLRTWYHPWNLELAKLMKDNKYLWNDI